ncbi:hypothetical protein SAMN02745163_04484 [Clostridium cavendishii DSM 21758]|uniref:Uncharacterized protein n=1 Tax=Clostridium cavendishii DSM 21758 TaxID=1121302 RepID=A0A1M6VFB6_9CLOT|nr:hypothetical protein [Clostridium cavendishii]SHK80170.1 hypothetical protein SAMN02745163_04484 [Clostridium cavendishii DSM 21758]
MKIENLLSIIKYSIICFFIIIIFILVKSFSYKELGLADVSCGEGIFSLYEYRKGDPNFKIYFGNFTVILSVILGFVLYIVMKKVRLRSKKMLKFLST